MLLLRRCSCPYFNPLPPHGGRRICRQQRTHLHEFQSTPSAWRETKQPQALTRGNLFQSTPSAWRETSVSLVSKDCFCISIHSLRMEGDVSPRARRSISMTNFNPLPPHGGRLTKIDEAVLESIISIHSLRMEGDLFFRRVGLQAFHFNPLPPHGGRRCGNVSCRRGAAISIHSLRMEGDQEITEIREKLEIFQSTPSAWRETSLNDLSRT